MHGLTRILFASALRKRERRAATSVSSATIVQRTEHLTVRKHPYSSARAATQALRPLLTHPRCFVSSSDTSEAHTLVRALREAATPFLMATEGVPPSLHHEGPLHLDHLRSLRTTLSAQLLANLLSSAHSGALAAPLLPQQQELWTLELVAQYTRGLLAAREDRLKREKAAKAGTSVKSKDVRYEAGLPMLEVMCGGWRGGESNGCSSYTQQQQQWAKLIDEYTLFLPDRSWHHELENLPQEVAIGELLESCVERLRSTKVSRDFQLECVVDVGGGNGILAAQVGERLGCDSLVIDPRFPVHSIDCLPYYRLNTVNRVRSRKTLRFHTSRRVAFMKELDWATDIAVDPQRTAFIAKHLCGSGIDECLAHLDAQNALPRVMVLVPCCFNKIDYSAYCNQRMMGELLQVHGQCALSRMSRLTDWNLSLYQRIQEDQRYYRPSTAQQTTSGNRSICGGAVSSRFPEKSGYCQCDSAVADFSHIITSATAEAMVPHRPKPRSVAHLVPYTHAIAQLVEAAINYGRVEWLRSRGYEASVVQYVPSCVTPKNKCIVAVKRE